MDHQPQLLIDFFMERMVDPVVAALKKHDTCSKGMITSLQTKIERFGEELLDEINRSQNSTEVAQTINYILDKVDEMEESRAPVSPPLASDEPELTNEGMSITEMILLNTLCSSDDVKTDPPLPKNMEPIEIKVESLESPIVSPPTSLVSSSDDSSVKEMPYRKRAKRSLEDTVQMLSKENSMSPPPPTVRPAPPQLPFMLPQVPVPFSNTAMMQRWLGSPFTNPVYLNAMNMFQQQQQPLKPSDEQLAALMKISMHAANFMKNVNPPHILLQTNCTESDGEDIKVDVESDEGEIGVSPSPSNGDMTENESSSSSSGPMTSPISGDGDSIIEKPFICMHNNCGKRFANKFLLKKHMFIHTGLRPHTCPHCHKKFNRKDNLLRHKKTHTPTESHLESILPRNAFHALPQLPNFPNLALTQGFNHFHALKMSLENGATAVRSLS